MPVERCADSHRGSSGRRHANEPFRVPQLANGQRRCSIRFKGWVLDNWAAAEFGARTFRRVIGYHADEPGRAKKDTAIQRGLNPEAGRTICEPHYPLILARMDRAADVATPCPTCPAYRVLFEDLPLWPLHFLDQLRRRFGARRRTADHPPLTSDKAGPGWAGGYSDEPPF